LTWKDKEVDSYEILMAEQTKTPLPDYVNRVLEKHLKNKTNQQ